MVIEKIWYRQSSLQLWLFLSAQATFFMSTISTLRRELATYGVIVSNLAEATKIQGVELASIAAYTKKYIDHHRPPPDPNDLEFVNEAATLPKVCQPRAVLTTIEAHQCRCYNCDPEFEGGLITSRK